MDSAPQSQQAPKRNMKKVFTIVAGVIGLLASTSTVVALVWGLFDSEPTVTDQVAELKQQQSESLKAQQAIADKLAAAADDKGGLVNQVSRQVTRLADEHKALKRAWKDIQRLAGELRQGAKQAALLAGQGGLAEAGRAQERKALS